MHQSSPSKEEGEEALNPEIYAVWRTFPHSTATSISAYSVAPLLEGPSINDVRTVEGVAEKPAAA